MCFLNWSWVWKKKNGNHWATHLHTPCLHISPLTLTLQMQDYCHSQKNKSVETGTKLHEGAWTCTKADPELVTPAAFTLSALSHLQPHSDKHVSGHLINTLPLSRCLPLPALLPRRGCVPRSRHLPIPPLACATLHLQGIKSEPPESPQKKDKKIGPNENQKHPLFLLLLLLLPPLPWTWKDERGGELNLI